jgi:hypothetical protein
LKNLIELKIQETQINSAKPLMQLHSLKTLSINKNLIDVNLLIAQKDLTITLVVPPKLANSHFLINELLKQPDALLLFELRYHVANVLIDSNTRIKIGSLNLLPWHMFKLHRIVNQPVTLHQLSVITTSFQLVQSSSK